MTTREAPKVLNEQQGQRCIFTITFPGECRSGGKAVVGVRGGRVAGREECYPYLRFSYKL